MRVIAGTAKRTNLTAPAGLNTRPTSDRAKENLFNIISAEVRGARFLDLFCGSGAIGIEALSRGAAQAVFVDNAPPALAAVRENLAKTRLFHVAEILEMSAENSIQKLAKSSRQFDIIYLDPPYDSELLARTSGLLCDGGLLSADGMIIAETDSKPEGGIIPLFPGLTMTDTREYGRTKFLFFRGCK